MQIFHLLIVFLQMILAVGLILIIAIQTTKSEQGSGIGTIGGQATTSVHKFGLDAQLTRVTTWIAVSYFVLSFVGAFLEAHLRSPL